MSGEQPNMFVLRTAEHVRFFVTAVKIVDSMAHADVVAWLRRWICSHNFALLVRLIHLRRQRPKAKAIPTRERVPNGGPPGGANCEEEITLFVEILSIKQKFSKHFMETIRHYNMYG